MRFEVPQFIEIEDKIFGPFTWKQFVYLGGGVGMAVVLFLIAPLIVTILVGIPLATLAAALAFYPVNSRPFSVLLESMWNYYKGRRVYFWRRRHDVVYRGENEGSRDLMTNIPERGKSGVNSLARKLELEVINSDTEEKEQ